MSAILEQLLQEAASVVQYSPVRSLGTRSLHRDDRQEEFKHWTEGEQQPNYRCEIVAASAITKLS